MSALSTNSELSAAGLNSEVSDRRDRQIRLSTICAIISRCSGLLMAYLSVSLAVGKLGTLSFGVWMTINSFVVLVPFADLGLGNGLVPFISRKIGYSLESEIGPAVASCFYITTATGCLLAILGILARKSILIKLIFRHQSPGGMPEVGMAIFIFFICLGLTLPATIVEKVQMGYQDAYISHLWQILANLLTCAALYWIAKRDGHLPEYVFAYSATPLVVKAVNSWSYLRKLPNIHSGFFHPDWRVGRYLLKQGTAFLLLQSSFALGYLLDNVILASQLGPSAVAAYDVVLRLFTITVIAEIPIFPLWGAFGEALGRGDRSWARTAFRRSLKTNVLIAMAVSSVLILCGPKAIELWTHNKVQPPFGLLIAFAFWKVFCVLQALLSSLLNHETTLRRQATLYCGAAIVAFGLKFILIRFIGMTGVIVASLIAFSVIYLIPSFATANAVLVEPAEPSTQPC